MKRNSTHPKCCLVDVFDIKGTHTLISDCISDINWILYRQKDLLKICWSLFSSLLCNLWILLYFFSHPALPYAHFLPLGYHILPSSTTLAFGFFPLPLPHLLSLYNLCIAAGEDDSSTHSLRSSLPFSDLLANPALLQQWGGQASHGNIQLTYPETRYKWPRDKCTCRRISEEHGHKFALVPEIMFLLDGRLFSASTQPRPLAPASASPTQCWCYFSNRDARLF